MKHILFIDPLEKLNIKKDSTLLLAESLKRLGHEVFLLFENDFFVVNLGLPTYELYRFEAVLDSASFYLKKFEVLDSQQLSIKPGDVFHMRLDPPFDTRYLKYLWMLDYLAKYQVKVINSPQGIMNYNEKLFAYSDPARSLPSYIGRSVKGFLDFVATLKKPKTQALIMKPLDLYQGMGVEKVSLSNELEMIKKFENKVQELAGAIIVQPFDASVESGEVRSLYFKGFEIGTILKVPPKGQFLANIAQGATYGRCELNSIQKKRCDVIARELLIAHVPWIAFDILGDHISEVNITCPGLLVEVSSAMKENLADKIVNLMSS
jgi:glutathione synthase